MEIRRLDVSQILLPNEKVECKTERKGSKLGFIPMAICYLFFLICLTGDCFFIGALIPMREVMKEKAVNNFLLPLAISLAVLHVVPFIFWFVFTLQGKAKNEGKWYLLTNKRVCIINSAKTLSVNSIFFEQITAMKVATSAVYLTVGEEKVVLDGIELHSFGERLEKLLTSDEEQNTPVFTKPQEPAKIEENNQPSINQPEGQENNQPLTAQLEEQESNQPLINQPEGQENNQPSTNQPEEQENNQPLINQPEGQEKNSDGKENTKNLTEQIDQVLQEFASKVLNEDNSEKPEEKPTEESK